MSNGIKISDEIKSADIYESLIGCNDILNPNLFSDQFSVNMNTAISPVYDQTSIEHNIEVEIKEFIAMKMKKDFKYQFKIEDFLVFILLNKVKEYENCYGNNALEDLLTSENEDIRNILTYNLDVLINKDY